MREFSQTEPSAAPRSGQLGKLSVAVFFQKKAWRFLIFLLHWRPTFSTALHLSDMMSLNAFRSSLSMKRRTPDRMHGAASRNCPNWFLSSVSPTLNNKSLTTCLESGQSEWRPSKNLSLNFVSIGKEKTSDVLEQKLQPLPMTSPRVKPAMRRTMESACFDTIPSRLIFQSSYGKPSLL